MRSHAPRKRPSTGQRTKPARGRDLLRRVRPELVLFAVALGLRLIYLAQSVDSPSFLTPLVDSETYDRAARSLAEGKGFGEVFFFQPFFYPFVLGLIYAVSGSSILAAKLFQAVVGAVTCVIVAGLGTRLIGRRGGLLAGAITAAYGPLIFLEAELVGEGWAALWSVALVWLFTAAPENPFARRLGVLGVVSGLAVITRPTFLPFVGAAAVWLTVVLWQRRRDTLFHGLAAAAVGGLLVVLPVAWLCHRTTGEAHVLPSSGGLNLYLGNNPEPCTTLTTRPGQEWHELVTTPAQAGAEGLWGNDRYFRAEVRRFAAADPMALTSGLTLKALQMVSSREIPRNLDIYLFRRWSSLLATTVWRMGPFGFPFGVLLPLAVIGMVVARRQLPAPLWLFLVLYPAAVVAVFVSGRYRVPVIPVLAIPAAAGALALVDAARQRRWRRLAVMAPVAAAAVALAVIPGPFCQEQDLEGEYWFLMAAAHLRGGDQEAAITTLQRAIEFEPSYFEARFQLGEMLIERGEPAAAVPHLEQAVAERPDLAFAHRELGLALRRSGRLDGAALHLRRSLELDPDDPVALTLLAVVMVELGEIDAALAPLERAVALAPDYPPARENLRWVRERLVARGSD